MLFFLIEKKQANVKQSEYVMCKIVQQTLNKVWY